MYINYLESVVPSGGPTRLQSTSINSTSLLFSWHAPNADFVNGLILQEYHIQVIDYSTGIQLNYTTDNTHLLLNNLRPNHQYTFRVAAYTNGRGPFSQLTAIILNQHSPTGMFDSVIVVAKLMKFGLCLYIDTIAIEDTRNSSVTNIQHQNQGPLTLTASILGLVCFILLIVVIVAGVFISYRLCKRDKKATRYHVDYTDNHARYCVL